MLLCLLLAALLWPGRTNILLLGVDSREPGSNLGRTDTMILATFQPLQPYVGMLAIPRDLWVTLSDGSQDRINTAHFYAEAQTPGAGPAAAMDVVRQNFGVDVDYYVRIRFDGLVSLVDALGGVEVTLPSAMSGYTAGTHHLNGTQALALVRDRANSDDLYRNARGQIFIKALLAEVLRAGSWGQLPAALELLPLVLDTDIPPTQWPRLAIALLRTGAEGIDGRAFSHEMVAPFTTEGGAAVLAPNWELINPVLLEMFGQ